MQETTSVGQKKNKELEYFVVSRRDFSHAGAINELLSLIHQSDELPLNFAQFIRDKIYPHLNSHDYADLMAELIPFISSGDRELLSSMKIAKNLQSEKVMEILA